MSNSMRDFVVPFVVLAGGEIDEGATLEKFQDAFANYVAAYKIERDVMSAAVDRVFDRFKKGDHGCRLSHSALQSFVLQEPEIASNLTSPAAYDAIRDMFARYMKDNTDLLKKVDRKTKKVTQEAEAYGTRKFHTTRGRNGGIFRISDFPEAPKDAATAEDES